MADHQHHVEEITGLELVILSKADIDHDHPVDEITGLQEALAKKADRQDLDGFATNTHTHSVKGIADLEEALGKKADSKHTHSIPEIFENAHQLDSKLSNALMAYLRQAITPLIQGSTLCSNKKAALIVKVLSTHGYAMSTVSIKFRHRLASSNNWISHPPVQFTDTVLRYSIELDLLPGEYVFDALLLDVHNPDLKSMTGPVTFKIP